MLMEYGIEFIKGIGRMLINPLFYWIILIAILVSYKRIKLERKQFGRKILPMFEEVRHTLGLSVLAGILLSVLGIVFGLYFTKEMMLILFIVVFLLSITASLSFLSASYMLGATFVLALFTPFLSIPTNIPFFQFEQLGVEHYVTLAFLMGFLLFIEGLLLYGKHVPSFPSMVLSKRGIWVGQHHIRRLLFVPFFVLLPASSMPFPLPLIPYVDIGDEAYMLVLLPFVLGVNYRVQTTLPQLAGKRIGRATVLLGLLVLLSAIASVYYPLLSFVTILLGIIGKEWITYRQKKHESESAQFYAPQNKGIKILAILPDSPAARLDIHIGETILKVNGQHVRSQSEFYEALQNSGAFVKLAILDINQEIRFVNSPRYEEDHYALGLVFSEANYA